MIISHKHRFVFIKTRKTAGTSMEIALSKYCGPDDIITPISPNDESTRRSLGYRGPQNCEIPLSSYSRKAFLKAAYRRRRLSFRNHSSAAFIMKYLDDEKWNSYFKFCFERNPWDKVVSWYYWNFRTEPRPSISEFIQSRDFNVIKGFELYTRSADILVDKVFFYENLSQSLEEIRDRVGLHETPSLPVTKGNYREDTRSYRDILSEKDRERISRAYAREIAYFDYEW